MRQRGRKHPPCASRVRPVGPKSANRLEANARQTPLVVREYQHSSGVCFLGETIWDTKGMIKVRDCSLAFLVRLAGSWLPCCQTRNQNVHCVVALSFKEQLDVRIAAEKSLRKQYEYGRKRQGKQNGMRLERMLNGRRGQGKLLPIIWLKRNRKPKPKPICK